MVIPGQQSLERCWTWICWSFSQFFPTRNHRQHGRVSKESTRNCAAAVVRSTKRLTRNVAPFISLTATKKKSALQQTRCSLHLYFFRVLYTQHTTWSLNSSVRRPQNICRKRIIVILHVCTWIYWWLQASERNKARMNCTIFKAQIRKQIEFRMEWGRKPKIELNRATMVQRIRRNATMWNNLFFSGVWIKMWLASPRPFWSSGSFFPVVAPNHDWWSDDVNNTISLFFFHIRKLNVIIN